MTGSLLVLAVSLFVGLLSPAVARQSPCTFVLGFAVLHDVIPEQVGECTEDEVHNPQNGDALQRTSNGLLVWRKADNWTAFTDGYQSWVNGPLALQQRLNTERFWWEANPDGLAIVPPPQSGERCHTAGLSLSLLGVGVGLGNLIGTFQFTNTLDRPCVFFGYPGAQLLDDLGDPVPTTVVRGGGYFSNQPQPSQVVVPAHGTAMFLIHWEQIEVGNETSCSMASSIAITPPDEYVSLRIATQIRACGGGHLDVSTVQPDISP